MARQTEIYAYLASWVQRELQEKSVLASYLSLLGSGSISIYIWYVQYGTGNSLSVPF